MLMNCRCEIEKNVKLNLSLIFVLMFSGVLGEPQNHNDAYRFIEIKRRRKLILGRVWKKAEDYLFYHEVDMFQKNPSLISQSVVKVNI